MTQQMTPAPDREAIRAYAKSQGFDAVRFATADTRAEARAHFETFLAEGMHGDMGWLHANADRRADPKVLWPEAKSVIMVGLNYGPAADPRASLTDGTAATVSVYARNRDYHDTLKKRLRPSPFSRATLRRSPKSISAWSAMATTARPRS